MEIVLITFGAFVLLIYSVYKNIFMGYPLFIILLAYSFLLYARGYRIREIIGMVYTGGRKSFIVLRIFLLIGAITAMWMASGTVSGIVYYGIKFLKPELFILSAFLISSVVSIMIGTSFGTVSTAGVALIVMARSGGVNTSMTAGAIIAGAYFGDRASPMSSSANLVASLTGTNLYQNIRNMFKTGMIPFILSFLIYLILSIKNPLNFSGTSMDVEISRVFVINPIVLLPALIILLLSLCRIDVKLSMLMSIVAALVISIIVQGEGFKSAVKFLIMGYDMNMKKESILRGIIRGGGVISMIRTSVIVFISSSLAGIFEGTGLLGRLQAFIEDAGSRVEVFRKTVLTSIFTAAFGCTQAISIILTNQLVKKSYDDKGIPRRELALDIENTSVVLSPLLPWNIAGLVPAVTLGVSWNFIPYAFYLYLVPLSLYFYYRKKV